MRSAGGDSPPDHLRLREQPLDLRDQLMCSGTNDRAPRDQDDVVPALDPVRELPPGGPQDAPGSVPDDRATDPPARDERHGPWPGGDKHYHPVSVERPAARQDAADPIAARRRPYAERRVRPFARRRLTIARPARVRIRTRKPCRLWRRRTLGWKVRLAMGPS